MNIYLENGYLDVAALCGMGVPFIFVTAARGTGKTYGALALAVREKRTFVYMRRTVAQAEMVGSTKTSPLTEVCADLGVELNFAPVAKGLNGIFIDGEFRGCIAALSTMANIRGIQDRDISLIIYDEFIPQPQERKLKREAEAWFNAYETLNRNRELEGGAPIQALLLSNSNTIVNPLYVELELVTPVDRMIKGHREIWVDRTRGYLIVYPQRSPVSAAKRDTALYRLVGEGSFKDMALSNEFSDMGSEYIQSKPLKEYAPICAVGELCIYQHKYTDDIYISVHYSGAMAKYPATDKGLDTFRFRYARWLGLAYFDGRLCFEDASCEALFRYYLKIY